MRNLVTHMHYSVKFELTGCDTILEILIAWHLAIKSYVIKVYCVLVASVVIGTICKRHV